MTRTRLILALLVLGVFVAATAYPERDKSVIQLLSQSRKSVGLGDLDAALDAAQAARAVDPASPQVWKQLGRVYMLRHEEKEALNSFQTFLELKPQDAQVHGWILHIYLATDRFEELVKHLSSVPDPVLVKFDEKIVSDLLYGLFTKSRRAEATKVVTRLGRLTLEEGMAVGAEAIRLLLEGRYRSAEAKLVRVSGAPTRGRVLLGLGWFQLGSVYLDRGNFRRAVKSFERALELRPGWSPALRELGWAYLSLKKPSKAADAWERGLSQGVNQVAWLSWIAQARLDAGQVKLATSATERLLSLDPTDFKGRTLKMAVLRIMHRDKEASSYQRAWSDDPKAGRITSMGHSLAERYRGRYAEAAHYLEELLGRHPEDEEVRRLLIDTYLHWISKVDQKAAVVPLEKLVSLDPGRVGAWRDLGWSLWVNGKRDEALNVWLRALKSGLAHPERLVLLVVGQLAEEGEIDAALNFYRQWNPTGLKRVSAYPYVPLVTGERKLRYGLHLASFRTRGKALEGVKHLKRKFKSLLSEVDFFIKRVDLGPEKKTWFRVIAGSFGKKEIADVLCRQFRLNDQYCMVCLVEGKPKQIGMYLDLGLGLLNAGRTIAARPFLEAAWEAGEDLWLSGLYLAYLESQSGLCTKVAEHLGPFLAKGPEGATEEQLDLLLVTLNRCSGSEAVWGSIEKALELLGKYPVYSQALTDLVELSAKERMATDYRNRAFELYKLVLERDPNRPTVWCQLALLAKTLGRIPEAKVILQGVLARATSPVVREGILGWQAERRQEYATAITYYRRSLEGEPEQPDLRLMIFEDLIALGQFKEARHEAVWFHDRVAAGQSDFRGPLVHIYSVLGETERVLPLLEDLHLAFPENPAYAIEAARSFYLLCRPNEAEDILTELVHTIPDQQAYELLGEIAVAKGRHREVLGWSEEGLSYGPTRGLLRLKAESAEALGEYEMAREAALALLEIDPGNASAARIALRAMLLLKRSEEARQFAEALLKRNPAFVPGLIHLREIAASEGRTGKALEYAEKMVEQRSWDPDSQLRRDLSLAEDKKFRPSLEHLRSMSHEPIIGPVPILIYSRVTGCDYPGFNTLDQLSSHLKRLAAEGFRFIFPPEIIADAVREESKEGSDVRQPKVMVVITDVSANVLEEVDSILQAIGGRAVYAGKIAGPAEQVTFNLNKSLLLRLKATGRWYLASSGPWGLKRVKVDKSGTLGNPLTHKTLTREGEQEGNQQLTARLDGILFLAAGPLGPYEDRMLLFPKGDYGQLSLDTDPETLQVLHQVTEKHFAMGLGASQNGFVTPACDPIRLCGRIVPASWGTDELMEHLEGQNPLVRARLELAKVLSWNSQYASANQWFRKAEDLGADPAELNFNWGRNAGSQGDMPTALEKLRRARDLAPNSEKIRSALEKVELRKRPLVDANIFASEDSDNRSMTRWGLSVKDYVTDWLQLEAFGDDYRWKRDGFGSEDGLAVGIGALWHFAEERRLRARLWRLSLEEYSDEFCGSLNIRWPNAFISGYFDVGAERRQVDTVEAVRKEIMGDSYYLRTYSLIHDRWEVSGNLSFTNRTDDNNTIMLDGRIVRRLNEWPYFGLGYLFRFADSDEEPPDYWAPLDLQQHQLYAEVRGALGSFHLSFSGRWGYVEEEDTDWRWTWGARLRTDYQVTPWLGLYGEVNRLELATYDSLSGLLGGNFRF